MDTDDSMADTSEDLIVCNCIYSSFKIQMMMKVNPILMIMKKVVKKIKDKKSNEKRLRND